MEQLDNQYETLSEAVEDLRVKGYTDELELDDAGLFHGDFQLNPERFTIDSFHRFEGPSDPADMSIVYAVSCADLGLKGLLIGNYGVDAAAHIHQMVRKLDVHSDCGSTKPVQAAPPDTDVKR